MAYLNHFLTGFEVFDGGPYKTAAELSAEGSLVLRQSQSGSYTVYDDVFAWKSSTSMLEACNVLKRDYGSDGLEADVQRLRLWSNLATSDEAAQQIQDRFEGNSVEQVCPSCCLSTIKRTICCKTEMYFGAATLL